MKKFITAAFLLALSQVTHNQQFYENQEGIRKDQQTQDKQELFLRSNTLPQTLFPSNKKNLSPSAQVDPIPQVMPNKLDQNIRTYADRTKLTRGINTANTENPSLNEFLAKPQPSDKQNLFNEFHTVTKQALKNNYMLVYAAKYAKDKFNKLGIFELGSFKKYSQHIKKGMKLKMIFDSPQGPDSVQIDLVTDPILNNHALMGVSFLQGQPTQLTTPPAIIIDSQNSFITDQSYTKNMNSVFQKPSSHKVNSMQSPVSAKSSFQSEKVASIPKTVVTRQVLLSNLNLAKTIIFARAEYYKRFRQELWQVKTYTEQSKANMTKNKLLFTNEKGTVEIVVYRDSAGENFEIGSIIMNY